MATSPDNSGIAPVCLDPRSPGVRWRCFVAMSVMYFVSTLSMLLQPFIFQHIAVDLGGGEVAAGFILMAEMASGALVVVLAGRYVSRHSARRWAMAGVALVLLASIGTLLVHDLVWLGVMRTLVGAGFGATYFLMNIIAANTPDPDKVFARVTMTNLLLGALLTAMYADVTAWLHGASPFGVFLAVALLCTPLMLVIPPMASFDAIAGRLGDPAAPVDHGHARLVSTHTVILCAILFAVVVGSGAFWTLVAHIGHEAGLTEDMVNSSIASSLLASMLGVALPAIFGQRFGRVLPVAVASVMLYGAVVVLASHPAAPAFRAAVAVNMVAIYFLMPYINGAAVTLDGGGKAAAYVSSTFMVATALSPVAGGLLAAGDTSAAAIAAVGGACVLLVIAGFVYLGRTGAAVAAGARDPAADADRRLRAGEPA